jgi:hypothetical protein
MAFIISYKMLFREEGIASLILTIALLIAILTFATTSKRCGAAEIINRCP